MPRKKSNKKNKINPDKILSYEGFSIDDQIWGNYLDQKIINGKITDFNLKNKEGPTVTIITLDQGYRTMLITQVSLSPIKRKRAILK